MKIKKLPPSFFGDPTPEIAKRLLGKLLIGQRSPKSPLLIARVTETEAYLGAHDAASHSFRGPTRRNRSMFLGPGTCYVYLIYGMHYCVNVVTSRAGVGEAVLLRAALPVSELEAFQKNRGRKDPPHKLMNGPAKLAQGFGMNLKHDGLSLHGESYWLGDDGFIVKPRDIAVTARIGITKSVDLPLRFVLQIPHE